MLGASRYQVVVARAHHRYKRPIRAAVWRFDVVTQWDTRHCRKYISAMVVSPRRRTFDSDKEASPDTDPGPYHEPHLHSALALQGRKVA